jgi:hypothetical protein
VSFSLSVFFFLKKNESREEQKNESGSGQADVTSSIIDLKITNNGSYRSPFSR